MASIFNGFLLIWGSKMRRPAGLLGRFLGALGVIFAPTRPPRDPRGPQEPPKTNELEKTWVVGPSWPPWASHCASPDRSKSTKNRCQNAFKDCIIFKSTSEGILIDFGSILNQFWMNFRSMLAIILKSVEIQKTMKNRRFSMDLQGFGSWIPKYIFEFSEVRSKTSF